jgi:hypothetical protein
MEVEIPEKIKNRWMAPPTIIRLRKGESVNDCTINIACNAIENAPICDGAKNPCPRKLLIDAKARRWLRKSIRQGTIKIGEWKHRKVFLILKRAGNDCLLLSTSEWFRRWSCAFPIDLAIKALIAVLEDVKNVTEKEADSKEAQTLVALPKEEADLEEFQAVAVNEEADSEETQTVAVQLVKIAANEGVVIKFEVPPSEIPTSTKNDQVTQNRVPSFSFTNGNQV